LTSSSVMMKSVKRSLRVHLCKTLVFISKLDPEIFFLPHRVSRNVVMVVTPKEDTSPSRKCDYESIERSI
jgi:hypothetical protein